MAQGGYMMYMKDKAPTLHMFEGRKNLMLERLSLRWLQGGRMTEVCRYSEGLWSLAVLPFDLQLQTIWQRQA